MRRLTTLIAAAILTVMTAEAQQYDSRSIGAVVEMLHNTIGLEVEDKDNITEEFVAMEMQVNDSPVADTAPLVKRKGRGRADGTRFLPMSCRIDRNIDVNKYVYRGETMLGLTASYGTMKASDSDLLLLLEDINVGLNRATIRPFVAFAYRDNRAVGLRVGYEMISGNLDNISLNLGAGSDLAFSLGGFGIESENLSLSLFHRNYMGLDRRGIVGVILESEILVKSGRSYITTGSGESATRSESHNLAAKLNLNPGLAVYVFPEVCVTVTVGIGGVSYNSIRQIDAQGIETGRRQRSYMRFKVNIADIQIGVVAHLWNKKKK